jgi:hypothetical protein
MTFNAKNWAEKHKAYFSNIRPRNGFYKFSQAGDAILTHRANTMPTIAKYGTDAFSHSKHPNTASAAMFAALGQELVDNDYPLYYLDKAVIEAFLDTDLSDVSKVIDSNFKPPLPLVFVAFPTKMLTDNEGDFITHAFIEIGTDPSGLRYLKVCCNLHRPGLSQARISIATDYLFSITEKGIGYGKVVGIEDSKQELDRFTKSPEGQLASIACQVLLILSVGDEYIETERAAQPFMPKRKGNLTTTGPKIPRTIRFPKMKNTPMNAPSGAENYKPKKPHWRRGHWRNQPYGSGNTLRKIIWMRPERINKKLELGERSHP